MTRKLRRLRRRLLQAGSRGTGRWLAGVLNAGGGFHERRGAYALAEKYYRESIRILGRADGRPESAGALIQSLGHLALVLRARARYDGAEKSLGPNHPSVATLYHNLGKLEHACGRYELGEPLARRSLAIHRKALGPDHPHVADDAAALASILDRLGRHDEATTLYQWALPIFERQRATPNLLARSFD